MLPMKTMCIALLGVLFLCSCSPIETEKDSLESNPKYSGEVELTIERITNNLQVETAIKGTYLSKSLDDQMTKYHTPGVSIAVINDGRIEWARGFGKRDLTGGDNVSVNTLFEAGSVSKPVFSLVVMRLKEKGMISLDEDVNEYLKSWEVPKNGDWKPRITLRQILGHTAGLTVHGFPGYLPSEEVPELTQILNGSPPANTPAVKVNMLPGRTYRYSGGGTTLAQLAIEDLTGQPLPMLANQELFEPMGLKYSTYAQPLPIELKDMAATAYPYKGQQINGKYHTYPEMAAAGLWTNPSELAKILIEVQNSLKNESALFKKETIEEMLTPQKVANHIGVGFFLESKGDSTRFGHGGWDEGFVAEVKAYKNLGKGAVIMINSNEGYPLLGEIMRSIAHEYNWPDYQDSTPDFILDPSGNEKYVGTYSLDNSEIQITTIGNDLALNFQNQDEILIRKTTDGDFRNDQLNFVVSFHNDKLQLTQNGQTYNYSKIKVN